MTRRAGWRTTFNQWRPSSLLHSLDLALIDPPSLCCDDDELCPACRAESCTG
jgi:hypothetical protein